MLVSHQQSQCLKHTIPHWEYTHHAAEMEDHGPQACSQIRNSGNMEISGVKPQYQ